MSDGDPHNRSSRIRNTVENIEKSNEITEENKEFLLDFKQFLHSQDLSKDRLSRYLYSLKRIAEYIPWEMEHPTKKKLVKLVGEINQSCLWDKEVSSHTKAEYRKSIRKWCEYLETFREDIDKEEMTDFFSVYVKKKFKDPDELPKPKHIAQIIENCNIKFSSLLMLMWSSSARIGAILGTRYKDIRFHSNIATVKFRDTKTGEDRKVPIASAFPYLKHHKENDPLGGKNPEAFVFRPRNSQDPENQLSYNAVTGAIDRAVEKADLPAHIGFSPHNWRRGRISDLARKNYSETLICKLSGHSIGSTEIRLYCRLASTDVEASIKQEAGLEEEDSVKKEDPLKPKKCPNSSCNRLNKWQNQECSNCGEILSTGELFKKVKTQDTEKEIRKSIVQKESSWDEEEVQDQAKELVEKKLGTE